MISLADFTTEWRNHCSSILHSKEFHHRRRRVCCPLPAQMDAGRRRMDIALSPPANGSRGPRPRMAGHVAINQGQRSQRYGQPELVQGCCTGSSREGGRVRACKHPLKTPAKQGVFSAEIVAHSFKRGAHSGGHLIVIVCYLVVAALAETRLPGSGERVFGCALIENPTWLSRYLFITGASPAPSTTCRSSKTIRPKAGAFHFRRYNLRTELGSTRLGQV
jgi:hypothetical protein